MNNTVVDLNLKRKSIFMAWQGLLESLDIDNFAPAELATIDETIGIYDTDHQLVATGSIAGKVLKYIGVADQTVQGAYFNTIVSNLLNRLAQRRIFHAFVFTKPRYQKSFEYVGFQTLASAVDGVMLETGDVSISDFIEAIPKVSDAKHKQIVSIVMNANPFTNGHRYLVEQASQNNDWVYIFVVNQDVSLFTTKARIALIQAGTKDLNNVTVVSGGDYMVSYATFPAYFLSADDSAINFQTTLDAQIFKNQIAQPLQISRRYLGTEPISHATAIYNETLQKELPPEVSVVVVSRKKVAGQIISATTVRQAIQADNLESIRNLVPDPTFKYIQTHLNELQLRIKEGLKVNGN